MRVLVCGDRNWTARARLENILQDMKDRGVLTSVIEGEARGADSMARDWALRAGVPVFRYPASWNDYGRAAGPIRNSQMLIEGKPEFVVAFHNDLENSKGTRDMVRKAQAKKVPVRLITLDGEKAL